MNHPYPRNTYYSNTTARDSATVHLGDVYNIVNADAKELRILRWLSPLALSNKHNRAWHQYEQGTLQGFFDNHVYKEWRVRAAGNAGPNLWCHGGMGTGKTTLAARVWGDLDALHPCGTVAILYCDQAERDSQTAESLLGSILIQLYQRLDQVLLIPDGVKKQFEKQWLYRRRPSLQEIRGWLVERLKDRRPVFLVIDAVDNLHDMARHRLLQTLQGLQSAGLNILATSRNRQPAEFGHEIVIKASEEDLRTVIRSRLSKAKLAEGDPLVARQFASMEDKISSNLIDSAKQRCVGSRKQWYYILTSAASFSQHFFSTRSSFAPGLKMSFTLSKSCHQK